LVIIAHRDFIGSVQPLQKLRQSQGLTTVTVDVEDVYDEFSYGAHSAQAVKDLLAWARKAWPRAPRFVLLVGDGSLDPRNYLGFGNADFVPAKLLGASLLETVSDHWLADFDDDGVPELALGRLPVRTATQAADAIAKIVNFTPGTPLRGALLVSDRTDRDGNDFQEASRELAGSLSGALSVQMINRNDGTAEEVRGRIVQAINQGPLVVNYLGHGSVGVWTGDGLLRTQDAGALANQGRLSLFVMAACLNGYYVDPLQASLGEAVLLNPLAGAVAVISSSALTSPFAQMALNRQLYRSLFAEQAQTLGEALNSAIAATIDPDVRRSYVLFGDPTMKLAVIESR
jgi:hypothetical protein